MRTRRPSRSLISPKFIGCGAGNTVNAESAKTAVVFGFKSYFTHADQTAVTLATFAQAEFTDPLTFTNPSGGAFDVTLDRLFTATDGLHGMELGGSGGPGVAGLVGGMRA